MKMLLRFVVVCAVAALSYGGYVYFGTKGQAASQPDDIAQVELGSITKLVTAQGTLEPKDYVDIGAQVSGLIKKMHIEVGDSVKNGDLIAEIDPDVYESQVQADEARLNQLKAQKAEQEALIKQAQWKLNRNKRLYKEKAVSKEVLEDAEISLDVAKASLMSIEAQTDEAESTLEGDNTNLGYTKIYSTMDGTVVDQSVQEGQTINSNQTTPTIVQVANMDVMTAKAEVAEADVMKLKEGMYVYFTTLGSGDRRWEGAVRQILPTPEEINDVVLYNVLVDVGNEDHSLLPGMTTQMFFVLDKAENVPVIPVSALGRRVKGEDTEQGDAYQVQVIGKDGRAEARVAIVSLSDRTQAAIATGLEVGERVVKQVKEPSDSNKDSEPKPPGMGRL